MSKELIERLRYDFDDNARLEAADLIEQQQSWIASLEQNARDADRMYKELETELAERQKRIDGMNSLCMFNERTMDDMLERLAASQAQIKVLREALKNVEGALDESGMYQDYPVTYDLVLKALSTPHDDSTLRELLKTALIRAAKVCDEVHNYSFIANPAELCAINIRTMEDQ